mmetsp:Transcript_98234/g.283456  ORF Transcript_98234/g.283456 Transcript_98234/m.283456 type:complete len:287 (+) Transcript_98234:489-1349(+)
MSSGHGAQLRWCNSAWENSHRWPSACTKQNKRFQSAVGWHMRKAASRPGASRRKEGALAAQRRAQIGRQTSSEATHRPGPPPSPPDHARPAAAKAPRSDASRPRATSTRRSPGSDPSADTGTSQALGEAAMCGATWEVASPPRAPRQRKMLANSAQASGPGSLVARASVEPRTRRRGVEATVMMGGRRARSSHDRHNSPPGEAVALPPTGEDTRRVRRSNDTGVAGSWPRAAAVGSGFSASCDIGRCCCCDRCSCCCRTCCRICCVSCCCCCCCCCCGAPAAGGLR